MRNVLLRNRAKTKGKSPENGPITDEDRRHAVAEILASETLRRSGQLCAILQYLSEAAIGGLGAQISESVIAIDVLKRNPSYNPTDDSSVRSRVYALRQKLAHYYEVENPTTRIRIEIPKGSYIPQFHLQPTRVTRTSLFRKRWLLLVSAVLLAVTVLSFLLWPQRSRAQVMYVWGPVIEGETPVLVSIGESKILQPTIPGVPPEAETPADLDSNGASRIGTGAARALFHLGGLFDRFHVSSQLRLSSTTSLDDLQHHPAVLLGAFNNQLALDAIRELRYHFIQSGSERAIVDGKTPSTQWRRHQDQDGQFTDDYGIAVRLMGKQSEKPMIIAAGLEQCGTEAGMELLIDDLSRLTRSMPSGWKQKNFEVLVAVHMVHGLCGAPEIIRSEVW